MKRIHVFVMDMLCMSPYHDRYFCEALQEMGLDVSLASISFHLDTGYFRRYRLNNDPGLLDMVAKIGVTRAGLRQALKLLEFCINLLAFAVRFLFSRPDVIHVQWLPLVTHTNVELWFLRLARRLGVRLVYSVHNVLPHDTGERYKEKFRTVYGMMDAVICHTESSRNRLISEFGQDPARIWVIPPGPYLYDSVRIGTDRARQILRLRNDECVVLFLGSVAPYKGLDLLLQAWRAALVRTETLARLIIVGPADARAASELRQHVEALSLQTTVTLNLGFVPDQLLTAYHEAADILVYPYKAITQSGALLTGITFGKPIIATNIPGFAETLKNQISALLVPYGNPECLASALVRLINDPCERIRLGEGVTMTLGAMNSWQDAARKTVGVYRAVLALPELEYCVHNHDLS